MKKIAVQLSYDPNTRTWGAMSEDLPNVYAVSDTREDVLFRFTRSANDYVALLIEENDPLPPALDSNTESVIIEVNTDPPAVQRRSSPAR